jgi:D-3-phosphoglycerate dehydrogenase / 2-oxoglutarate reductase
MGATVLLTDRPFGSDEIEEAALAEAGMKLCRAPDTEPKTLARLAKRARAMLVCYASVGKTVIEAAERRGCKVISRYGIGYDNIGVEAATRARILVTYVPDYCFDEFADHTLALLLGAARRVPWASLSVRKGRWEVPSSNVHRIQGRRLALIGLWRIGGKVAARARAFGIRVVAYDPYVHEPPFEIEMAATLEEAVSEADFISLHAPLTDETRHVIDERAIAVMRRPAILVNTSRGGLVDLPAATRELDDGHFGCLALDVTEVEPLPDTHPLRTHPDAIVTPHVAFYSADAQDELQRRTVGEVLAVLSGQPPRNPVNPEVLDLTAPFAPGDHPSRRSSTFKGFGPSAHR